jgi:hypothetical protein
VIILQEWTPHNVCCTTSGDLLVIMVSDDLKESKVVSYSGSERKKAFNLMIKVVLSGNTKYISQNRNLDIFVVDYRVNIISQSVRKTPILIHWSFLWYYGIIFDPRSSSTDSQSHILTADDNKVCIHILDQDRQFLLYSRDLRDQYFYV